MPKYKHTIHFIATHSVDVVVDAPTESAARLALGLCSSEFGACTNDHAPRIDLSLETIDAMKAYETPTWHPSDAVSHQYQINEGDDPDIGATRRFKVDETGKDLAHTNTTGKYSQKRYRCTLWDCGVEYTTGTNHYGDIYGPCPECKMLTGERAHRSVCIEPLPAGWERPQPWKRVLIKEITDGSA